MRLLPSRVAVVWFPRTCKGKLAVRELVAEHAFFEASRRVSKQVG